MYIQFTCSTRVPVSLQLYIGSPSFTTVAVVVVQLHPLVVVILVVLTDMTQAIG